MINLLAIIIYLYLFWRFIFPLPFRTSTKWIIALFVLFISQYHLVVRMVFGSISSPELPIPFLILQGFLFGTCILLAIFLLLKDIITLFFWLLHKIGFCWKPSFSTYRLNMCLCLVAFILSGIGVWQAVRIPDIKTVEITVPDLPSEFNNLKLVQISDLHASPLFRTSWVQAVVNKTNALNPDLILMTGDIIDGSTEKRTLDVVPLHNLKARLGVFGVVGNHEYYSSHSDWIKAFSNLGLHMLENEHVVITENGQSLVLAGLTDKVAANFGKPLPDIKTALSGAPKDATIILMVHQPKEAEINAMAGVDLQISGHTHGGQIFGLHLLAQYINDGYISGLYQINKMQLYISNGAGLWNGFPLRLGQPSEITQIILRTDQR